MGVVNALVELVKLFLTPSFTILILSAGIRAGTPILYATIGEIFTERSGVMNLGVEGMMLMGAMSAFAVSYNTGNAWLGLLVGSIAGALLSLLHAFVAITLRGDQVISGLALTILGAALSAFFGAPLVGEEAATLPSWKIPLLGDIVWNYNGTVIDVGSSLFTHNVMVYGGFILFPLAWFYINRTRPGLNLRAVGEHPATADVLGINVYLYRYGYVALGGLLCGAAGANLSLAYSPLWLENMTAGLGWIAVGLVIFASWSPMRAAFGAYMFGAIRRLPLDLQTAGWGPLESNPNLVYFLAMLPYIFTILILIIGSVESVRKRMGAPAALGIPYIRGERGV